MIAFITVTALAVNTLCSLFGQPRIFFRMAKDGLLFEAFAKVHETTLTPIYGTIIVWIKFYLIFMQTGCVSGLIAMFMNLDTLSDMISIGTLLAFTTVCIGVVLLRYEPPAGKPYYPISMISLFICVTIVMCVCFKCKFFNSYQFCLRNTSICPIWVYPILAVLMLIPVICLFCLETVNIELVYKCPLVPFFPLMGVFFNIYLISSLNYMSYVRVVIWTAIGFALYFLYGVKYSKLRKVITTFYVPIANK